LLTAKLVTMAVICGLVAIVSMFVWMREADPAPAGRARIGGGIALPTYMSGPMSHSWWAMVVLMLVASALYLSYVFSYLYLWTVAPSGWPALENIPAWPYGAVALLGVSGAALWAGDASLRAGRTGLFIALICLG